MNPARRRSTLANTDAKAIAARACFLCPENMPPEERGVAFEDLVLLPNPFPILPLHCTIADREHRPQQLRGRIATFLHLAQEIGPDMAALYNGPRCGASAPDHFHLQAARANEIPILAQLSTTSDSSRQSFRTQVSDATCWSFAAQTPLMLPPTSNDPSMRCKQIEAANDEPMFNLLAHFAADHYTAVLFPAPPTVLPATSPPAPTSCSSAPPFWRCAEYLSPPSPIISRKSTQVPHAAFIEKSAFPPANLKTSLRKYERFTKMFFETTSLTKEPAMRQSVLSALAVAVLTTFVRAEEPLKSIPSFPISAQRQGGP